MRISLLFLLLLSFFQKLDQVRRGACMGDISRPCILIVLYATEVQVNMSEPSEGASRV